ncbi:sialate O-acetylesterase [Leadbetterella sp. DM7]|uniref:sialate O-acetylesterase n=1 Tax=Leadbetterella sp. DM7 TaxID=3235085 RepID=UPI00349EFDA8
MNLIYKEITSIFFFLCICTCSYAQLSIQFPVERSVFQRNNNNTGNVHIYGNVKQECDRVEARLIARSTGQGVSTSWTTIDSEVAGKAFSGKIQSAGGWYRLEVRGIRGENVLFSGTVERVGIGEVFVIAGQSNAQGDGSNPNAKGATDDRVNAFQPNYYNEYIDRYENLPDFFSNIAFTKINANTNIGPSGVTPWCYGELGDMLASRLNVPILFFNAATTGTSSRDWQMSINGGSALYDPRIPYLPFKITLQSINKLFGIRSVLWHQGEFDTVIGSSQAQYYDNIKSVIDKSRADINAVIPWVVSRVSLINQAKSQAVIEAQNRLIANVTGVWGGPETDNIQPARYDGAHFQNTSGSMGLSQLATAWNGSLTDNFFVSSSPVLSEDIVKLQHSCSGSTVRLSTNRQFSDYYWNNGNRGSSLEAREGSYQFFARDAYGNIYQTNAINVGDVFPAVPVITAPEGLLGCEGKTLPLQVASSKYEVHWNSGYIGNNITVSNEGSYAATYRSAQNCYSASSPNTRVNFVKPPLKPTLTFINSDGNECEGNSIRVAITNVQGGSIQWSTGETSSEIILNRNLDEPITTTLYSLPNCPSPVSDVVNYKFFPTPPSPTIMTAGPFYLHAENALDQDSFNWSLNGSIVSGGVGEYFHLEQPGVYRVQAEHAYTKLNGGALKCISGFSDEFLVDGSNTLTGFSIYPNPVSDGLIKITSDGERQNLEVFIHDITGREIYKTHYDVISYPRMLDLRSYNLSGKYFVVLKYENLSKTFPMVFVK